MTCLNSTNIRSIQIKEPDPEIWGDESSSKWDRLEIVLAPKRWVNTKVDLSRLDPNLKVIISQCDMTDIMLPDFILSVVVPSAIRLDFIVPSPFYSNYSITPFVPLNVNLKLINIFCQKTFSNRIFYLKKMPKWSNLYAHGQNVNSIWNNIELSNMKLFLLQNLIL